MKRTQLMLAIFIYFVTVLQATVKVDYNSYFTSNMMRVDIHHGAILGQEFIAIDRISKQGKFAANKKRLLDELNLGQYQYRIYDAATNVLIFSRGYSSIFQEWLSLPGSKKSNRVFEESLVFPYPRKKIVFAICGRDRFNHFKEIFSIPIDPTDPLIFHESKQPNIETIDLMINGPVGRKVDLVIIGEGYIQTEIPKFKQDLQRITNEFFSHNPFSNHKKDFNIRGICAISLESGPDMPERDIYRVTAMDAQFYSLRISRYLTIPSVKKIYDYAACVPYDHILVLVNTERYGGAGFYNLYCSASSNGPAWQKVLLHEFGHAFAGLADEYSGATLNLYSPDVEPWEANITTNPNPQELKWKHLVSVDIALPTPDSLRYDHTKVGMWEGGGYSAKAVWRPAYTCRMRDNSAEGYCPVCCEAIERVIKWYVR